MHRDDVWTFVRLYTLGAVHDWNHASSANLSADECRHYAYSIADTLWPVLTQGRTLYGAHSDLTLHILGRLRQALAPHHLPREGERPQI